MSELKQCLCGGVPEYYTEYVETAFGDRKCLAVRCSNCKARTSLFICADPSDQYPIEIIEDLWNRGCIGGAEDV